VGGPPPTAKKAKMQMHKKTKTAVGNDNNNENNMPATTAAKVLHDFTSTFIDCKSKRAPRQRQRYRSHPLLCTGKNIVPYKSEPRKIYSQSQIPIFKMYEHFA